MTGFGIAGLQLDFEQGNNLERLCDEIALAKKKYPWVSMILAGELCCYGPRPVDAQPMPGPAENRLREAARDVGVWLIPGSIFEARNGAIYNTAPVIDPQGEVVVRYRKMFPWRPYEKGITAGAEFVTFDIPEIGRFGVSICYDTWFPETTRALAWMGAEVILHPSMTSSIDRDVELAIARAGSATNQCYIFDINVAGRLGVGQSIVTGPGGEVILQAGAGREVIAIDVDFAYLRRVRRQGWHNLGQPLKSFRDSQIEFPQYAPGAAGRGALAELGPIRKTGESEPESQ